MDPTQLARGVLQRDRRSAARLISLLEDRDPRGLDALRQLRPHTGRAHVVGVTGPPGAGKSTLIGQMVRELRRVGRTVGVLAADPTSPRSGGAFLGDRLRMQGMSLDAGVFIRSMATRGAEGGVGTAVSDAASVLDAFGCQVVLVETVGTGQSDLAVADLAHTVVLVVAPNLGDEIQAIKAGILEVAHVLVVNKSDQEGSAKAASYLALAAERTGEAWKPPIVRTVATSGEGLSELLAAIDRHRAFLQALGRREDRDEARARRELAEALKAELLARLLTSRGAAALEEMAHRVARRELDVEAAARQLLDDAPRGESLDS